MAKQRNNPSQNPYNYQYAAKFICTANLPGTSQTTSAFLPGRYQTAVNIHNPHEKDIRLRKKQASPFEISRFIEGGLKPDGVERVTCSHIDNFGLHPIHGFEGFLVIESTHPLDVVAVYTAGSEHVNSIDVVQVRERKID